MSNTCTFPNCSTTGAKCAGPCAAPQPPQADRVSDAPDCRTCRQYSLDGCLSVLACDGSAYQASTPVRLYGGQLVKESQAERGPLRFTPLLLELAETWVVMAEMEGGSTSARRETLRECADGLRMLSGIIERAHGIGTTAHPPALTLPLDEAPVWECKAGGLKKLSQRLYDKQPERIKRHYTRILTLPQQHADELLEALRGMLALDEEHHQRGADDEDVCAEVQAARAAIARATGETR